MGELRVEPAVYFLVGLFFISFVGGILYRTWYTSFYKKPNLFRTQVSLEIDERIIYLNHISSLTEEYVHSTFLMSCGFLLGFAVYVMFFFFTSFNAKGLVENVIMSVGLTTLGGGLGALFSLSKQLVIHDSGGTKHVLRLKDFERIELKQELTKDIWKMCK